MSKLKLAIFSDIHYSSNSKNKFVDNVQRKLTGCAVSVLDKLAEDINDQGFDLAVCMGDLIEDAHDRQLDFDNLQFIYSELNKISPPVYTIPGNHDLRTLSENDVRKIFGYDKLTFSIDANGCHLVFLATSVNENASTAKGGILRSQSLSDETLSWLKQDIANNDKPSLYFIHYGVAEDEMAGNFWFENNPEDAHLANRKELKEILKTDSNLFAIFNGHQHWTKQILENGMHFFQLGSLTENINNDGVPDGVWYDAEIEDEKLTVKTNHVIT